MINITGSCDPEKLKKVIMTSRVVMKGFYGLTEADREEILMNVVYRFEADNARFPVSVYARHCRNKIIGFLGQKTAQKRMASKIVDGKRIFFEDVSLNMKVGEEEDMELSDILPTEDFGIMEIELLSVVEAKAPEMVEVVKSVLHGGKLTKEQRAKLRRIFRKEDFKNCEK